MDFDNKQKDNVLDGADESLDIVAVPMSSVRISASLTPVEMNELLARRDVQERIRQVVVARVRREAPPALIDDLVQDANVAAISSKWPPTSKATAPGWLAMVAARTVALHFRREAAKRKWLEQDGEVEVDDLVGKSQDSQEGERTEAGPPLLLGQWLAPLVAEHPRDQETYELLVYKSRTGKSHEQIAEEHAMTTAALKNRIHKFKLKYEPQWRRHKARRQRLFVFLFLLGLGVAAVIAYLLGRPQRAPIGPNSVPSFSPSPPRYAPDDSPGVSHPRPDFPNDD